MEMEQKGRDGSPFPASSQRHPKSYNWVSLWVHRHVPRTSGDGEGTISRAGDHHSIPSLCDMFLCITYQLAVCKLRFASPSTQETSFNRGTKSINHVSYSGCNTME